MRDSKGRLAGQAVSNLKGYEEKICAISGGQASDTGLGAAAFNFENFFLVGREARVQSWVMLSEFESPSEFESSESFKLEPG